MIDKRTCKFYNETRKRCNALKEIYCEKDEGKPCSFYKPKQDDELNLHVLCKDFNIK